MNLIKKKKSYKTFMLNKNPFIFEMANNHMGDLDHGLKIIDEFKKIGKLMSLILL